MDLDDLSQSGIRRIANYSPYLDQLAGLASEMGLRQRSNLVHLERCLHDHWSLGQNSILSWAPLDDGLLILVVPHYAIAEYTAAGRRKHEYHGPDYERVWKKGGEGNDERLGPSRPGGGGPEFGSGCTAVS